jgi:hypothetical protein
MAAVGGHPHAFGVAITHEERVAVGGVGRPVATTQTPSRRPRRDASGSAGGSRRDDPQAASRGALAQLPVGMKCAVVVSKRKNPDGRFRSQPTPGRAIDVLRGGDRHRAVPGRKLKRLLVLPY